MLYMHWIFITSIDSSNRLFDKKRGTYSPTLYPILLLFGSRVCNEEVIQEFQYWGDNKNDEPFMKKGIRVLGRTCDSLVVFCLATRAGLLLLYISLCSPRGAAGCHDNMGRRQLPSIFAGAMPMSPPSCRNSPWLPSQRQVREGYVTSSSWIMVIKIIHSSWDGFLCWLYMIASRWLSPMDSALKFLIGICQALLMFQKIWT